MQIIGSVFITTQSEDFAVFKMHQFKAFDKIFPDKEDSTGIEILQRIVTQGGTLHFGFIAEDKELVDSLVEQVLEVLDGMDNVTGRNVYTSYLTVDSMRRKLAEFVLDT